MKTALLGILALITPYIDGGGTQITLPEIILEFHTATLVEVDKADPARGAIRWKTVKPLKGNLAAKEIKLQIYWEGAQPPAIKEVKPGHLGVFFTQCFDHRSLIYLDGTWAWTSPAADGWENGNVRHDFEHVFIGSSKELSDAVAKLLRGHDVLARARRRDEPSALEWVRYSMMSPNLKALARDPSLPPARNRPLSEWTAELEDKKPELRAQAALALAELGPAARPSEAALVRAGKDKDPEVRYGAVLALGRIGTEDASAVALLAHALSDENWFVRYTATQSLCSFGPHAKAAVPALIQALKPSDPVKDFRPIRCALATVALAHIDPQAKELQEGIQLIEGKLLGYDGDGSDGARAVGAELLGDCGPPAKAAEPALARRLKDEDGDVRVKAAEALLKVAPEQDPSRAISVLEGELKNPGILVRILAAETLGKLGARAKGAGSALVLATQDAEPEVRQAAEASLRRVDPERAAKPANR